MRRDSPYKILWLVPIIFAIHNVEELPQMEKWADKVFDERQVPFLSDLYTFESVALAMLLLTITVGVVIYFEYKFRNRVTYVLSLLSVCLLLVNGIVHLVQFLIFKQYVPGLISACFLLIPFLSYIFYGLFKSERLTKKQILVYLTISLVAMNPIIILFLLVSKLMIH
ncbi:HXXEE domain-containing protein [Rossellomorea oryzaecorticis]|uniref:HXXEE domain-containing protein n=1 Tax=Rossellomorea oryzaecorticis TaxID=1396505 RepID=A0ABU9K3Q6_9BACI